MPMLVHCFAKSFQSESPFGFGMAILSKSISQVMKDMRTEVQVALELRDSEKLSQEKEAWRQRASKAWATMAQESATDVDVTMGKRNIFRTKSLDWLYATDNMLWVSSGHRWSDFFQPQDLSQRAPPLEWPICSVSIDQGTDGWAACYFLMMVKHCGLLLQKDPSHRIWNDVWLSIEHAQLKPHLLLVIVMPNSDHGPWKDARWFQTAREGAQAYMAVGSETDVLFERHVHEIIQDMGLQHRLDEGEALFKEVWESIPECVLNMSIKVATSRWFGVYDSLERFLPMWSRRLLLLHFIGVELGLWSHVLKDVLGKANLHSAGADQDAAQGLTAQEGVDVAAVRKACKNTLHLCCLVLGDRDIHNLCIGVVELVRPVRAEFQWQHKLIRSTFEASQAYTAYAMGRGRESLHEAVDAFLSGPVLEQAGAHYPGNWPPGLAGLGHEDPLVLADNLLVSRLATFLLQLIKNRLRSTSWSELGYPGRFAACLHSDTQAAKVLEAMKEDWANWLHVQGLTRGPWKQNKKRSPFHLVVVQKAMLLNTKSF